MTTARIIPDLDYNTDRQPMRLAEYGRNIEQMVAHTRTIADREERNRAARAIIKAMGIVNPTLRNTEELNHKLWDHLFILADFDLDVDSPYPKPSPDQFTHRPDPIAYPESEIRERHYGRILIDMIAQLSSETDPEKRTKGTLAVANAMKGAYLKWNRDTVEDAIIIKDLTRLSGGKITLAPDTVLGRLQDLVDNTPVNNGRAPARKRSGKRNNNKKRRNR